MKNKKKGEKLEHKYVRSEFDSTSNKIANSEKVCNKNFKNVR